MTCPDVENISLEGNFLFQQMESFELIIESCTSLYPQDTTCITGIALDTAINSIYATILTFSNDI